MSKSINDTSKSCGPGQILRKGYTKKGYVRSAYQRKDGKIIPSAVIPTTKVPPTCVPDFGKPGHGRKTLPKPDDIVHLTKYGYSVHASDSQRHDALRAASRDYGTLTILRRLNLLRNYQAIPENKEIFSQDVEYMKQLYDPIRKVPRKKSKMNYQSGGNDFSDSDEDETVEEINLPETNKMEINTIIDRYRVCNQEGKCGVRNVVYEMHQLDDKQIVYYTLDEKDVESIWEMDKKCIDSQIDKKSVQTKLADNLGLLIGINVNGNLEGYCQYEPYEDSEVEIVQFCVNKGFTTALYVFMEKYFALNDYQRIKVNVSLSEKESTRLINFWYAMGFTTYHTTIKDNKVHLEKNI